MRRNKMLPLGSVVYLKAGTAKTMIINRGIFFEDNGNTKMFEYEGCLYPNGSNLKDRYYFNEEDIDEIIFRGYEDKMEERFQLEFEKWRKEHAVTLMKVDEINSKILKKKTEEENIEDQLFNNH